MIEDIQIIKKEIQDLKNQRDDFGLATELIKDKKKEATRMFWIWIITFLTLIGLAIYTISKLEEMQKIETTQEITDVDTISGNVANGDINGED